MCVPLWSFLFRQTINISIPDHKTVGDLKTMVADELNDPNRLETGISRRSAPVIFVTGQT